MGAIPPALAELGYVEGKNLVLEWRWGGGDYSRLPTLAEDLVRLRVDIIVTEGTPGIRAAQGATTTIPIVFLGGADVVDQGLVQSLAHPGGNTTGCSLLLTDMAAKQIELLKAWVPKLSSLAVLVNPTNPAAALVLKQVADAALVRHIRLVTVEARTPPEIDIAIAKAAAEGSQALLWIVDTFLHQQDRQIASLASKYHLPSMGGYTEYPGDGGLMGYGPDRGELWRHVVAQVAKILHGANPGEIPVEQPTKLELVINRTTAKALGLTIPPELLVQADRMIE